MEASLKHVEKEFSMEFLAVDSYPIGFVHAMP